ncbi:hypothetical protein O1611_g4544 [Lasiodiplodia mahajangana]|uniref:Uncharacterized protein n=1 Tax=Lasiodiplodia mahajangana TaxID=1108764 RepID=A0ACC2JPB7_9PEZI|nr:hypothetical protein O1611_g4544 [Lasiodiplodia mahajangana]
MYSEHDSLSHAAGSFEDGPYSSSLASSASSSSTSVFSEPLSQNSDDTSITTTSDSSDLRDPCYYSQRSSFCRAESACSFLRQTQSQPVEIPRPLRQNPRRTSNSAVTRNGPPTLARQSDRKVNFVDNLVDSSTQIVEAIWPLASVFHRQELGHKAVLPLRTFIQETLRRSRTSYSTLQVALYYLILIKPHVPNHDFTMEQPDDIHAVRALQCGRRMFLAALILASKYLQDRNYSARAWSKISGLATQEINQNEMAFLSAVSWKLHITDAVFKRWTEIILKHIPSQPPSSGSACLQIAEQQCLDWKNLILQLDPDLGNIEDLIPINPSPRRSLASLPRSPNPSPLTPRVRPAPLIEALDATPTPQNISTPTIMEPAPATAHTPGRLAPALGLLPTPRLTPQLTGFSTPTVTTNSLLGGRCSMSFAMAQAAQVSASQTLDRWPGPVTTSPRSYTLTRRPSLANSISTASSPESMISDSSRTSRSSSISSASSLASAPSVKLDVQARCRNAKLYGERYSMKPAIASVPEDYEENCITSSPESYTGTVGKDLYQMSLDTPLTRRDCEMEDAADAARALQELQNYHHSNTRVSIPTRPGLKRSRRVSTDDSLQENVREMLIGRSNSYNEDEWQYRMGASQTAADIDVQQTPVHTSHDGCRKRLCYSTESIIRPYVIPALHPAVGGPGGPGMWEGILN